MYNAFCGLFTAVHRKCSGPSDGHFTTSSAPEPFLLLFTNRLRLMQTPKILIPLGYTLTRSSPVRYPYPEIPDNDIQGLQMGTSLPSFCPRHCPLKRVQAACGLFPCGDTSHPQRITPRGFHCSGSLVPQRASLCQKPRTI